MRRRGLKILVEELWKMHREKRDSVCIVVCLFRVQYIRSILDDTPQDDNMRTCVTGEGEDRRLEFHLLGLQKSGVLFSVCPSSPLL